MSNKKRPVKTHKRMPLDKPMRAVHIQTNLFAVRLDVTEIRDMDDYGSGFLPYELIDRYTSALGNLHQVERDVIAFMRETGQPIPYPFDGHNPPVLPEEPNAPWVTGDMLDIEMLKKLKDGIARIPDLDAALEEISHVEKAADTEDVLEALKAVEDFIDDPADIGPVTYEVNNAADVYLPVRIPGHKPGSIFAEQ